MRRFVAFITAVFLACTIILATAPATTAATLYLCTKGSWQRVYTTSTWTAWTYTVQGWYCRPA